MRSKLVLGGLFVATTASLTFTVTGLAGSAGIPGTEQLVPSAAAAELVPFEDCDELLQWYVDEALPEVGPYGLGTWPMALPTASVGGGAELAVPLQRDSVSFGAADTSEEPVGSSGTGTNVQEAGVDEPDRAKTDGELVVHVRGKNLVVTDVSDGGAKEVGTLTLPRSLAEAELLLAGDTALVLGPDATGAGFRGPMPVDVLIDSSMPYPMSVDRSRLLAVSLEDPTDPVVVSDQTFGGTMVSARQHGDTVRLVLSTAAPVLDFVQPNRERSRQEATEENRDILRASTIDDWLPTVSVSDGEAEPLVDCGDVRHPTTGAGYGTITVVTLDAADPTGLDTLGVTTGGQTVYSSTDRLYLATWSGANDTQVHAFALDGPTTSYAASGEVDGRLDDRWSMDEHGGVLRLALAHGPGWSAKENGITTLREEGGDLVELGSVRGLGPDEEIKSVRWFDDLAVVVTFRQTDPLYTVDLTDPSSPTTLGALKIPGFSEYLHPIGGDLLLGLGQDATMSGRVTGGQASLFDIGDLDAPERTDTLALGARAYPTPAQDPRTFTWLADRGVGLAVIEDGWSGRASVVELVVDGGALTEGRSWPLERWSAYQGRALPLPDGSVAMVDSAVEVVTLG